MAEIVLKKLYEQRDVDAAIYLLSIMLGNERKVSAVRRMQLENLKLALERDRHITPLMRKAVISNYREIIG